MSRWDELSPVLERIRRRCRAEVAEQLSLRVPVLLVQHPEAPVRSKLMEIARACLRPDEPRVFEAISARDALSISARDVWLAVIASDIDATEAFDTAERISVRYPAADILIDCADWDEVPLERIGDNPRCMAVGGQQLFAAFSSVLAVTSLRRARLGAVRSRSLEARAIASELGPGAARTLGYYLPPEPALASLERVSRSHVVSALEQSRGNRARAARLLGIDRAQLYRLMAKMAIDIPSSHRNSVRRRAASSDAS